MVQVQASAAMCSCPGGAGQPGGHGRGVNPVSARRARRRGYVPARRRSQAGTAAEIAAAAARTATKMATLAQAVQVVDQRRARAAMRTAQVASGKVRRGRVASWRANRRAWGVTASMVTVTSGDGG